MRERQKLQEALEWSLLVEIDGAMYQEENKHQRLIKERRNPGTSERRVQQKPDERGCCESQERGRTARVGGSGERSEKKNLKILLALIPYEI